MMRWIFDACTLIYLVKSELFEKFHLLSDYTICIDSSVYNEVVTEGKAHEFDDALIVEKVLKTFKIPIIPVEIGKFLETFRDPGETSTFLLAKEDGVGVTSDRRAYTKFRQRNARVIKLEQFFFQKYLEEKIDILEFMRVLKKLEEVWAITSKDYLNILVKINYKDEKT